MTKRVRSRSPRAITFFGLNALPIQIQLFQWHPLRQEDNQATPPERVRELSWLQSYCHLQGTFDFFQEVSIPENFSPI
jgi:hypothetical protein